MSKRKIAVVFAALVAAGLIFVTWWGQRTHRTLNPGPPATLPTPAPAASDAELALISPLLPGELLEGYTIREVRAVEDGHMRVVVVREPAVVQLDVALAGDGTRSMATAGQYAVFYSLKDAPDGDGQRLAKALAAKIHAELPPPAGMTVFVPRVPDGGP